jgi:ABC-type glycerol-3-phosphate transport system substrate-binding protein
MFSRPILLLLAAALLSGALIAIRPRPQRADLTIWVFSADHARELTSPYLQAGKLRPALIDQYREQTGKSVAVELIGGRGLDTRLLSLLSEPDAPQVRDLLPDLVEIEIGSVGQYLRSPAADVPLLPLDRFLDANGLRRRLATQRLATWSRDGTVFGLPLDVHPVALVYRSDLFYQAGVDLDSVATWPQLRTACQHFTDYWRSHGFPQRTALALHRSNVDELLMMLQQRHISPLTADGQSRLDNPLVAQTIAFYATLVSSPDDQPPIAADPTPGPGRWAADVDRGDRCAALVPDWAIADLWDMSQFAKSHDLHPPPTLRMRTIPLFEPGDAPTASWGGTAAAIVRRARNPQASWDLLQFLYCSPASAAAQRYFEPDLLSAFPDQCKTIGPSGWADRLFYPQQIRQMFSDLAVQLPPRIVSPFGLLANLELSKALAAAVAARQAGADEQTLTRIAADSLRQGSAELRQQIDFEKLAP